MTELLTARDIADRLGVTPATVLRWTRDGSLPGIRLPGGALRYRTDLLERWLEQRATLEQGVLAAPDGAARRLSTVPSSVLAAPDDEREHR